MHRNPACEDVHQYAIGLCVHWRQSHTWGNQPSERTPFVLGKFTPILSSRVERTDGMIMTAAVSIQRMFDEFRQELDSQNDRKERLFKSSRDITNLSKKVIFLLHRIMNDDSPDSRKLAHLSGMEKLREVQLLYASIKVELQDDLFWYHHRSISPGLQEYIEALSFAHYLGHGVLVSYSQVRQTLSDENGVPFFPLPPEDYLLGLSDLTGELMRLAISGIARNGGHDRAREICTFVRQCKTGESPLGHPSEYEMSRNVYFMTLGQNLPTPKLRIRSTVRLRNFRIINLHFGSCGRHYALTFADGASENYQRDRIHASNRFVW
ncbi:hypothetical protein ID866_838 [Astraeus odoratus]|nr:hypothetical protein ID866_838 [Astraeus odoratus]